MERQLIIFFLLLSFSNCVNDIMKVPFGGTTMTRLGTVGINYFYVPISNTKTSGSFQIHLEDFNFYLDTNLYYVPSNTVPTSYDIGNYNFSDHKTYDKMDESAGIKEYYYDFTYKKDKY